MTTPFDFRPVLFAVFWKSGIALGAALGISRMLRNRSADLRRLVFSTNHRRHVCQPAKFQRLRDLSSEVGVRDEDLG